MRQGFHLWFPTGNRKGHFSLGVNLDPPFVLVIPIPPRSKPSTPISTFDAMLSKPHDSTLQSHPLRCPLRSVAPALAMMPGTAAAMAIRDEM